MGSATALVTQLTTLAANSDGSFSMAAAAVVGGSDVKAES